MLMSRKKRVEIYTEFPDPDIAQFATVEALTVRILIPLFIPGRKCATPSTL